MRSALATALLAAALAGSAAAQQSARFSGVAVDIAGAPLAGLPVSLHALSTGTGGQIIARDTADADGRFEFRFASQGGDDPIYFAATRRGDTLFVGPPVRLPLPAGQTYTLVVAPQTAFQLQATASPPTSGFGPPPTQTDSGPGAAGIVLALIAVLGMVGTAALLWRRRSNASTGGARRRALLELAEVEEALADPARAGDGALRRSREDLRARVRTLSS